MLNIPFMANRDEDKRALAAPADGDMQEQILAEIRTVYDPEIPVNILDLGLIYDIDVDVEGDVDIRMTLTAPACPVAGTMPGVVEKAVKRVAGVGEVNVELVWDPPWSKARMSEEARLALGMYE